MRARFLGKDSTDASNLILLSRGNTTFMCDENNNAVKSCCCQIIPPKCIISLRTLFQLKSEWLSFKPKFLHQKKIAENEDMASFKIGLL